MAFSYNSAYDRPAWDRINCPFSLRLQKLVTDPAALAKYLGCTVQAVNQYKTNSAFPKTENLIKIAEYYQVSLDYLLGFSDVENIDTSIKSVNAVTGLSVDAICKLHDLKEKNDKTAFTDIISLLIEDDNAEYFLAMIKILITLKPSDSKLIDVDIAGEKLSLHDDNFLKAVFQTKVIENIQKISMAYDKQYGGVDNGKC